MIAALQRIVLSESNESRGMSRVEELIESSRTAISDCSLENGAIVAANADKHYYPKNVANYRFIWPRDAGFTLYAANILGLNGMEKQFFDWLMERAEGFKNSGIIYHRYSPNGPRDTDFGHQFQPDQAAALLWAVLETNDDLNGRQEKIIHLLADGLWSQWNENCFHGATHDLWEERECHPDLKGNFSYTLAACSEALYLAAARMGEDKWHTTADMMRERLEEHVAVTEDGREYYPRSYGDIPDKTVDAAILGLTWPFNVVQNDDRLRNSVELVAERCMTDRGVMRYPGDMYDGMVHHTKHLKKGAGAWPLLTFWHCIALKQLGREDEARELFEDQIHRFDGKWIPEQIFDNDHQTSIKPLAWSHTMFVIAAKQLGYF
jgi:GH15 family glucan-1,4-alpha-glucosidase